MYAWKYIYNYYIFILAQLECNNTGEIIQPPQSIVTIKGELVQFNCLIQGNLSSQHLLSYWRVYFAFSSTEYPKIETIFYNTSYDNIYITHYQTCSTNNESCCSFVSRLIFPNISLELNGSTVSCVEYLDVGHGKKCQKNATLS